MKKKNKKRKTLADYLHQVDKAPIIAAMLQYDIEGIEEGAKVLTSKKRLSKFEMEELCSFQAHLDILKDAYNFYAPPNDWYQLRDEN